MNNTILWFIWIPTGVILLFLRASESALTDMGVFMKHVTAVLLAIGFALYSLIALLSVERHRDSTSSPLISNPERLSELGLRVVFQR